MSKSLKIDLRDLKNVSKKAVKASQAQSSALKQAGYELRRVIKEGMQREQPGGEYWPRAHPWTSLGRLRGRTVKRRAKWGRTEYTWTERRRGGVKALKTGKKPLSKLAGAVRYRATPGVTSGDTTVKVGFLTSRAGKLAEYHASGPHTQAVTNKMRRMLFAAGLGIKSASIKIPRRRHVEPVWERNRDRVAAFVSDKVAQVLGGGSGRRRPDFG